MLAIAPEVQRKFWAIIDSDLPERLKPSKKVLLDVPDSIFQKLSCISKKQGTQVILRAIQDLLEKTEKEGDRP